VESNFVLVKWQGRECVAIFVRDLTEQRRAMEALKHAHEQQKIADKAKAQVEIAAESNIAKSRFLARMSHEIRTPISAVLGISEIELRRPNLPKYMEESLSRVNKAAKLLLGIINDILDLSKIEAGKMDLLQEPYDIANLINTITQLQLTRLLDKDIEFKVKIDENLPATLVGDSLRIEQAVNNILSNAIKYTESGFVELFIGGKKQDNVFMLQIIVKDSGLGMNQVQLSQLNRYNEYVRFHEKAHRNISGTGLGIPIVFNLINMMNAEMQIDSEVDKGTTVTINIPQHVSGKELLDKETAEKLEEFQAEASFMNKVQFTPEAMPYGSVLVVDDVETNLFVAQGYLSFYDLKIETCISGYEALEKIRQGMVYDIIFMDHMMPGMDGIETMLAIRAEGYKKPIIALTANAMIGMAEEFIKTGFDDFISKPIQSDILNNLLEKHVKEKASPEIIEAFKAVYSSDERFYEPSENDINEIGADLMENLRLDFVKKQKNVIEEICETIDMGDVKTAILKIHNLKGLAALIHEESLSKEAENFERLLDRGKTPSKDDIKKLETHLSPVIEAIEKQKKPTITERMRAMPKKDILELLCKLKPLLKQRKSECFDLLEDLKKLPEAAILVRHIEKFEFKAALGNIDTLLEIINE